MVAALETPELPRPHGDPNQAERRKANCSGHPAHLSVLPLGDRELNPGGGDRLSLTDRRIALPDLRSLDDANLGRSSHAILKSNASPELLECRSSGNLFYLSPVDLRCLSLGRSESMLKLTVIGEDQEAFGVFVQSTSRIDVRDRNKIGQGPVPSSLVN